MENFSRDFHPFDSSAMDDDSLTTNELIYVCSQDQAQRVRAVREFCDDEKTCLELYCVAEKVLNTLGETCSKSDPLSQLALFIMEWGSSAMAQAIAERALDFEGDDSVGGGDE
jgi:hypothetical protein